MIPVRSIVLCVLLSGAVLPLSIEECLGASKAVEVRSIKKTDNLRAMGALVGGSVSPKRSSSTRLASNIVGILKVEAGNYELKTRDGYTVRYSGDGVLPIQASEVTAKGGMIQAKSGYLFCRVEVTATMSKGDSYNCLYEEVSLRANVDGAEGKYVVNGSGDDKTGFVIGRFLRLGSDGKKTTAKKDKKESSTGDGLAEKTAKDDEKFKTTLVFIIPEKAKDVAVLYRGRQLK